MQQYYIDSDRHGYLLKNEIIKELSMYAVEDLNFGQDMSYPLVARNLAVKIQKYPKTRGILICKTGIGMQIVANKLTGIYANNCNNELQCKNSVEVNNCNVLCIGASVVDVKSAICICKTFLECVFDEKHQDRMCAIRKIEEEVLYGNS